MTWTRLPDDFADSPAMLSASRSARLLHVEALVWCNKHLTDGFVPAAAVRRLTDSEDLASDTAELVAAGLWTWEDGWRIDWADQERAERVKERKSFNAERQRKYRERGEKHARGDHSECTSSCPKASRNASRNDERAPSVTATRPVPSRPLGRDEKGTGAAAPSAGAPGAARRQSDRPAGFTFSMPEVTS